MRVDAIIAGSTPAALAAKQVTGTIPIVMTGGDPSVSEYCAEVMRVTEVE